MFKKNRPVIEKKGSVTIDKSVKFGKNVHIGPGNIILGNTVIGDNTVLGPNNYIKDSVIGKDNSITFSYIEESIVFDNCKIGPYSRLRPKSEIHNNCKIGNFVEIKNSVVMDNTKASHLSYVGDAEIGRNCNIGCGAIFVNYNGKEKFRSVVGDNCFVGSNVNVVAPVNIASNTYICAGTTITKNTNNFDFVIGRVRETIKADYAKLYIKGDK